MFKDDLLIIFFYILGYRLGKVSNINVVFYLILNGIALRCASYSRKHIIMKTISCTL